MCFSKWSTKLVFLFNMVYHTCVFQHGLPNLCFSEWSTKLGYVQGNQKDTPNPGALLRLRAARMRRWDQRGSDFDSDATGAFFRLQESGRAGRSYGFLSFSRGTGAATICLQSFTLFFFEVGFCLLVLHPRFGPDISTTGCSRYKQQALPEVLDCRFAWCHREFVDRDRRAQNYSI